MLSLLFPTKWTLLIIKHGQHYLSGLIISISFLCMAPISAEGQSDSTTLYYETYIDNILLYHPMARQAKLQSKLASAERLGAKGVLDPTISSSWNQKNFDDKRYYRLFQADISIPTPLGIDVVAGYNNSDGAYLNPEHLTDDYGLWRLGVEVDILQGLIVNERKIARKQAEVFQDMAQSKQLAMLNDLVYNASSAYLIWQQYHHNQAVLNENKLIANTYFRNTKEAYLGGEKTVMDTLEAYILDQDATILMQKNERGLIKSKQLVQSYLWYEDEPLVMKLSTEPEHYTATIFEAPLTSVDSTDIATHPAIMATMNKLSYYEIEQRLKREKLKPKLKLKYNPLLATGDKDAWPNYELNNYKWGFNFSMPLLFRSEQADIQRGEVKMQEIALHLDNKRNELQAKSQGSWQQQNVLQEQVALMAQNVQNYKQLLDMENEKFTFGESSVFLLNKRQEKYINGQLKLIEIQLSQQLELLNFLYYSNRLLD